MKDNEERQILTREPVSIAEVHWTDRTEDITNTSATFEQKESVSINSPSRTMNEENVKVECMMMMMMMAGSWFWLSVSSSSIHSSNQQYDIQLKCINPWMNKRTYGWDNLLLMWMEAIGTAIFEWIFGIIGTPTLLARTHGGSRRSSRARGTCRRRRHRHGHLHTRPLA